MKLTVKRSDWLRGEGPDASFLLREDDGKMCCLGFLACQLGATPEEITHKKTPGDTRKLSWPDSFFNEGGMNSECCNLFNLNDKTSITDELREKTLIEGFVKHGIELEFVD